MRVVSYIHNAFKLFRQPRDLRGVGALCGRELFSLRLAAFARAAVVFPAPARAILCIDLYYRLLLRV